MVHTILGASQPFAGVEVEVDTPLPSAGSPAGTEPLEKGTDQLIRAGTNAHKASI